MLPNHEKKYEVPVEAISNGIDLSEFRPGKISEAIRKKYNIDITKPKLIYVGRVDPEKSINISIDAFYEVVKNIPDVEFLIVGDGIDRDNLKNQVANLGIESKVKFLGRVMPPDLQQIYRAGDVFVTASETETQGIVLIEAAATGLPLVAVDAGAVRELCQNKKNGILCQPGDVKGIARAIIKILSDKELKARYGKESLEIAKKHDLNYTLSRFEEIYQTAIKLQTEED